MNKVVIFSLALLAIFACSSDGQRLNVTWGVIGPYDRLLDRETVLKKAQILQIVTEDFRYPKPGYYNYYNITGIRVADQYTSGSGASATLLEGGVGYRNVTIHLKSQRSQGFNFEIEIFGR